MKSRLPLGFSFPAQARFDVVGFGFNTDDHLCVVERLPGADTKQRLVAYQRQPGGQIPTALVALQRWGLTTAYVGPIGDDEGGERQRASLAEEQVALDGARLRPHVASQTSFIVIDAVSGARTVLWQRPEGLALRVGELNRDLLTAGRVLLMDADEAGTAIQAAEWARAAGVMVVLDVDVPGPRTTDLLRLTDVVIVSDGFPQRLTGARDVRAGLRRMAEFGPRLAVVTLGGGGALAYGEESFQHVPAPPVPVVDTTSAGDLFHAGCIYGLLTRATLADSLSFAAAAAALVCTRLGGRGAIPALEEVKRFVERTVSTAPR